jgi:outer membrane lipoprotein-sorting protein
VDVPNRGWTIATTLTAAAMLLLLAGAAALRAQAPSRTRTASPESFDQLYERGQRANAAIKTLTARFTETTTSSLLTRPLVAHGTLAVERPTHVVLHYTDPEVRSVLIDAKRLTISWPSRHVQQVTDIGAAQGRVQKYFVNGSAAALRDQFDIQQSDAPSRPGTYEVTMVPKRKQIRDALARLDLWVDQSSLLLSAMRMTFANGDTKLMAFEDVVPNAPIDAAAFTPGR